MTTPTTVSVRLQLRADTAANWTSANPTLLANELGRETDTGKIKIGDGSTAWSSLAYQAWATLPIAVASGGTGQTSYTNGQLLIGNTTGNTLTKATLTAGSGIAITNGTGSITVAASGISDAQIAADAEIAVSKLADGAARQLLQTDAAGTGVEWASNIDIPGTLDVTSAATFDSTIGASAGTASLPSITFTGDLNTGIYSPGADQVAISTNGANRFQIDSSGNITVDTNTFYVDAANNRVGVGTTSPSQLFHVNGGYSLLNGLRISGADTSNSIYQSAAFGISSDNYITLSTGTGGPFERLRIDSSGRVGIGTSTVGAQLEVLRTSTTDPSLRLRYNATSYYGDHLMDGNGNYIIYSPAANGVTSGNLRLRAGGSFSVSTNDQVATSPALTIDTSGRLGIGSTGPQGLLHLQQSLSDSVPILVLGEASNSVRYSIIQETGYTGISHGNTNIDLKFKTFANAGTGGAISFWTGSTSASERARLDSSGRLLVGTSSARSWSGITPQFQSEGLDVSSASASFTANMNSANGSFLSFIKSRGTALNSNTVVQNNDILGAIYFNGTDGSSPVQGALISAQVDGTPGANDMPGRLVFSTTADGASSPTERMRLINSGFLKVSNDGSYQSTTSGNHEFTNTLDTDSLIVRSTNASYSGNGILALATRNTTNNSFYAFSYYNSGASAYRFRIADSGNATNTNNSYGAISDIKLKENIVNATSQWDDIKALQVRKYNFKEETGQPTHTQIGLIAQEVELVSPGLVSESPDRDAEGNDLGTVTKSVNYSVLYMKAVKALQEAMLRIEDLEARLDAANL